MIKINTPSFKNKEGKDIKFISFEDRNNKNHSQKIDVVIKKDNRVKKTDFLPIIIVIAILILFMLSAKLNEFMLYGGQSDNYKSVNKVTEKFAKIEKGKRSELFYKIGYDIIKEKKEIYSDKIYNTTYAYIMNKDNEDYISVYYDEHDVVKYVMLGLNYNKEDYTISKVARDSNTIISNFVNVIIKEKDIKELNEQKHLVIEKNEIKIIYDLVNDENQNIVTILVQ